MKNFLKKSFNYLNPQKHDFSTKIEKFDLKLSISRVLLDKIESSWSRILAYYIQKKIILVCQERKSLTKKLSKKNKRDVFFKNQKFCITLTAVIGILG